MEKRVKKNEAQKTFDDALLALERANVQLKKDMSLENSMEFQRAATTVAMALLGWKEGGGVIRLMPEVPPPALHVVKNDKELVEDLPPEPGEAVTLPPEPEPKVEPEKPIRQPMRSIVRDAVVKKPKTATSTDMSRLVAWSKGNANPTRDLIESVLKDLPPIEVNTTDDFNRAMANLDALTDKPNDWDILPKQTQKALVGYVTARARHFQDEAAPKLGHPFLLSIMDRIFAKITAYSKSRQPGFVKGLQRHHSPDHGQTWIQEANFWMRLLQKDAGLAESESPQEEAETPRETNPEKCLANLASLIEQGNPNKEELVERVTDCLNAGVKDTDTRLIRDVFPFAEMLQSGKRFKSLRKAIRDYMIELEEDEEEDEEEEDNGIVDDDWPHLELTFGKRVLVLGGDKREKAMDRIREAFLFEAVEWETGLNHHRVKAMARKIENGAFDYVLLLARFAGHDIDDAVRPACKSMNVPFIIIERGYGVSRVKYELEQYFASWS